jgi:hypothetical protein
MAKFDIKTIDFKSEAQRGLHAGVGAADRALEVVKEYVAEAQKRFDDYQKDAQKVFTSAQRSVKELEIRPKELRSQATTVLHTRVEGLSKDAKARRTAIEKRVVDLQGDATETFEDFVKRGETVVKRLRKQSASVADPGPVSKTTGATTTAPTAPAKKAPVKKATATKTTAKKAPAKKTAAE